MTPRLAVLALLLTCGSAAAHDLTVPTVPGTTITVLQPAWPDWGRQAGEGRVRLVYHSADLAARMGVNDFHAYERAYHRRLADLVMRMPLSAADPIARHGAWHEIVGRPDRTKGYTTEAIPRN